MLSFRVSVVVTGLLNRGKEKLPACGSGVGATSTNCGRRRYVSRRAELPGAVLMMALSNITILSVSVCRAGWVRPRVAWAR